MNIDPSTGLPKKVGLYDPALEKDSCGVGFIVSIDGISSNKVLQDAKKCSSEWLIEELVGAMTTRAMELEF